MNDYLVPADKVSHYAVWCFYCGILGPVAHSEAAAEALTPLGWKRDAYDDLICIRCQEAAGVQVEIPSEQPSPDSWQAQVIALIDKYQKGLRAPYGSGILPDDMSGMIQGLEAAKRILRGEKP